MNPGGALLKDHEPLAKVPLTALRLRLRALLQASSVRSKRRSEAESRQNGTPPDGYVPAWTTSDVRSERRSEAESRVTALRLRLRARFTTSRLTTRKHHPSSQPLP
jgi:hypothetical protein